MKALSIIKVAGTVILYNSKLEVLNNILSYVKQVEKLFVVDNSDELPNEELINLLKGIHNVTFISSGKNEGIAKALNKVADICLKENFDYLLTMDDDTSVPENMVSNMLNFALQNKSYNIAIIAPQSISKLVGNSCRSVFMTITSGSLLCLDAYSKCGPFMNDLFIDRVDHEYCIRLKILGYKIVVLDYLPVIHNLGCKKNVSVLGININWTSHSPIRRYYKTRNTLYLLRNYFSIIPIRYQWTFLYEMILDLFKSAFLEDSPICRLKLLYKAVCESSINKVVS